MSEQEINADPKLTLRCCASSNRLSASVFLSFPLGSEGEARLLPDAEPGMEPLSSFDKSSLTRSRSRSFTSSGFDFDFDFFFLRT